LSGVNKRGFGGAGGEGVRGERCGGKVRAGAREGSMVQGVREDPTMREISSMIAVTSSSVL